MLINLQEIPENGRAYDVSQNDEDVAAQIKDLIGETPFRFDFHLTPAGQAFDLKGEIKVSIPLVCSRCANEFSQPVDKKIRELLMQEENPSAKGLAGDPEMGLSTEVTLLKSFKLDVGEILHEQIALLEPSQPLCSPTCKGLCFTCGADLNEGSCGCTEQKTEKPSAFSVLKNLKLN